MNTGLFVLMVALNLNTPEIDPWRTPYFKQEFYRVVETKHYDTSMECQKIAKEVNKRVGMVFDPAKPRETVLGGWCLVPAKGEVPR